MTQHDERVGTIWVCVCCLFTRESEHDHNERDCGPDYPAPWALIDGVAYDVTMGMVFEEHECGRERGEDIEECDCERRDFDKGRCDGCGCGLAGERQAYTLWQRGHTWADGFGIWHVRVPAYLPDTEATARVLLRDEISARDVHAAPWVWEHPERVPAMDDDKTIVYREAASPETPE